MATTQATNNLLWSRSRGLCNLCGTDLSPLIGDEATLTGFRCHITAENERGPRYDAQLSDEQRNHYSNLMLLCGDCHIKVDKRPDHYTVALLHFIKAEHERKSLERLKISDEARLIRGEILANAVDLVVDGLSLERWDEWTRSLLSNPRRWPLWALKEFYFWLYPAVHAVLWPRDASSLSISAKISVDAIVAFSSAYSRKSMREDDYLVCESRGMMLDHYRGAGDPIEYERYLMDWEDEVALALVHLAKCVNFLADAVREHVEPRFRLKEGAFVIEPTPFEGDDHRVGVHHFSDAEKAKFVRDGYIFTRFSSPWTLVRWLWDVPIKEERRAKTAWHPYDDD